MAIEAQEEVKRERKKGKRVRGKREGEEDGDGGQGERGLEITHNSVNTEL